MLDGTSIARALAGCGVTHVVWIPDSVLGTWDHALDTAPELALIRVCREGEAFAVAAGLHLGGAKPVAVMQCTGLFEAGDSLRNFVHDLGLPLFALVGVRNLTRHRQGKTGDTAPRFAEAIVRAWQIPYRIFEADTTADALAAEYVEAQAAGRAELVLLAE